MNDNGSGSTANDIDLMFDVNERKRQGVYLFCKRSMGNLDAFLT